MLGGGTNPNNLEVAFDDTNTAGITSNSVVNAATATKGFELRIPLVDLGLSANFAGALSLAACIERTNGVLSNQWLPGLAPRSADLGVAPNLTSISGQQYLTVNVGVVGDIDGDGVVTAADLAVLLSNWGAVTSRASSLASDINDDGFVDASDLALLLSNWS